MTDKIYEYRDAENWFLGEWGGFNTISGLGNISNDALSELSLKVAKLNTRKCCGNCHGDCHSDDRNGYNVTVVKNTSLTEATPATSSVEKIISDVAWEVAACSDYSALAAKITDLKTEGIIEKYGRYASLDSPQEYYLAIYNTAGKIVAILSPGQNRININTKNPDSEKNYSGCGAIGFKVK